MGIHVNDSTITVSAAIEKLAEIYQLPNENINDYNIRFRRVIDELRYVVQDKHKFAFTRRITIEEEENTAIQIYTNNIKPEIGIILIANKPATTRKAQGKALEIEAKVKDQ